MYVLLHFIVQWRDSTVIINVIYHVENSAYMHNGSISYYISDEIHVHLNMDGYSNSYNYRSNVHTSDSVRNEQQSDWRTCINSAITGAYKIITIQLTVFIFQNFRFDL